MLGLLVCNIVIETVLINVQGIIPMEACGVGYWIISSVQFPLAIIFTSWILYNRESKQNMPSKKQVFISHKRLCRLLNFLTEN